MMNPWDREPQSKPSNGIAWLLSVIIAVIGLVALAKGSGHKAVSVPIFMSVIFMLMFLFSHRRENRRVIQASKEAELQRKLNVVEQHTKTEINMQRDKDLRRVFDRFDVKVIKEGRRSQHSAQQIAQMLDFSRDFVDTNHAIEMLSNGHLVELDKHLEAAIYRAVLQLELSQSEQPNKPV